MDRATSLRLSHLRAASVFLSSQSPVLGQSAGQRLREQIWDTVAENRLPKASSGDNGDGGNETLAIVDEVAEDRDWIDWKESSLRYFCSSCSHPRSPLSAFPSTNRISRLPPPSSRKRRRRPKPQRPNGLNSELKSKSHPDTIDNLNLNFTPAHGRGSNNRSDDSAYRCLEFTCTNCGHVDRIEFSEDPSYRGSNIVKSLSSPILPHSTPTSFPSSTAAAASITVGEKRKRDTRNEARKERSTKPSALTPKPEKTDGLDSKNQPGSTMATVSLGGLQKATKPFKSSASSHQKLASGNKGKQPAGGGLAEMLRQKKRQENDGASHFGAGIGVAIGGSNTRKSSDNGLTGESKTKKRKNKNKEGMGLTSSPSVEGTSGGRLADFLKEL